VEGLARDTACRAAGQIGESGPPRSADVRKGSSCGDNQTTRIWRGDQSSGADVVQVVHQIV
jgi:hypothetical protein